MSAYRRFAESYERSGWLGKSWKDMRIACANTAINGGTKTDGSGEVISVNAGNVGKRKVDS